MNDIVARSPQKIQSIRVKIGISLFNILMKIISFTLIENLFLKLQKAVQITKFDYQVAHLGFTLKTRAIVAEIFLELFLPNNHP